ncbi:MAG TPA: hypothetical protein VKU82_10820 [Planctomycetaceae bacterium]|nr:hypothetical protein [Planctomycetaceae bacterium]
MPRSFASLVPLFSAAFLVALAGATIGSPAAYAGCGDYVHLGREADASAHRLNAGNQHQRLDSAQHRGAPGCQGPNCRGESPAPAVPAPAPVSSGPDQKAYLSSPDIRRPIAAGRISADEPLCFDPEARLRIERPPRIGS